MPSLKCANPECNSIELVPVNGDYALTKIKIESNNEITFNPASGIPIKCYICPTCGEIRIRFNNFKNK